MISASRFAPQPPRSTPAPTAISHIELWTRSIKLSLAVMIWDFELMMTKILLIFKTLDDRLLHEANDVQELAEKVEPQLCKLSTAWNDENSNGFPRIFPRNVPTMREALI
jgi:hypothetical protein